MSSETLFWIAVAVGILWLIFFRGKEQNQKFTTQVVKPSTKPDFDPMTQDSITFRKNKPPSFDPGSPLVPTSSSQRQQVVDLDSFSNSGETVWKGSGPAIGFEYVDSKGVITQRVVYLKRYFHHSGGTYISGQCRLRQADRSFKTSRIGDTISVNNKQISKQKFFNSLKMNQISSLLSDSTKNNSVIPIVGNFHDNHSPVPTSKSRHSPQQKKNKTKKIDWRKEGLLSTRGYRVGKTKGLPISKRHAILEDLLLRDGLNDVDDPEYAASWGKIASQHRLNKLSGTLKSLADIAEKRSDKSELDLSKAISDWRADQSYVESLKSRLTR